jgi:hypothetical protein
MGLCMVGISDFFNKNCDVAQVVVIIYKNIYPNLAIFKTLKVEKS